MQNKKNSPKPNSRAVFSRQSATSHASPVRFRQPSEKSTSYASFITQPVASSIAQSTARPTSIPLVSRAGYKLLHAAQVFKYDFRGKTVLDIGSSTGGFTEVALISGANKVIAVEIGTRQMHPRLATHPKVELHEKTDFLKFNRGDRPPVDTIVADISFLSLTKIIKCAIINRWVGSHTDFLVMFKPQFEVPSHCLVNGILKNSALRRQAIKNFELWLKSNHLIVKAKQDNILAGKNGNLERFYWLKYCK